MNLMFVISVGAAYAVLFLQRLDFNRLEARLNELERLNNDLAKRLGHFIKWGGKL